jgi:hypothetical protein
MLKLELRFEAELVWNLAGRVDGILEYVFIVSSLSSASKISDLSSSW